jgi:hypothetical protein
MPLASWLDDWTAKALRASDRRQATVDLYAAIARRHLVPALGSDGDFSEAHLAPTTPEGRQRLRS